MHYKNDILSFKVNHAHLRVTYERLTYTEITPYFLHHVTNRRDLGLKQGKKFLAWHLFHRGCKL